LISEFWHCWTNGNFIRLIRLLKPCVFLIQLSWVIGWNHMVWKNAYALDPARVNDQFAADSDGNLRRVIAHSQGSREK
jgi:hypothetical protein